MMSQQDIQNAVEAITAMRPEMQNANKREPKSNQIATKRMTDIQFQLEMAAIMRDETPDGSAFFFSKTEPVKGGNKNANFNPYRGEVK
jgi:hypothetical protein